MRHEELSVGKLVVGGDAVAVTQGTNRTTGVTADAMCGTITTNAGSLAAGAEATFTVTNRTVKVGSQVLLTMRTPSTTGLSMAFVSKVQAGSFDITVSNLHGTTADTSASVVDFLVINAA
jgi:hypothetical protein